MAFKKRTMYRSKRKRSYRSKRKRFSRAPKYVSSVRTSARSVLPPRLKTKLVYNNVFDPTVAANTPWEEKFALLGMNDPWLSGAGHQPRGFDQFASFYNNYVVNGCKVVIEGNLNSTGAHQLSIGGLNNGLAPAVTVEDLNEYAQYSTMILSNQRPYKFKKYFSADKLLGLSPGTAIKDDNYWGLSTGTSNPSYGGFLDVQMRNLDVSATMDFQISVTLVYYVTYFNLALLPFS